MRATLTPSSPVFSRPTSSRMTFGFVPAASTTVDSSMSRGMCPPVGARAPAL